MASRIGHSDNGLSSVQLAMSLFSVLFSVSTWFDLLDLDDFVTFDGKA
jgi:hypothetical protein